MLHGRALSRRPNSAEELIAMTARPASTLKALPRASRLAACLLLLGSVAACAPTMTATTYNGGAMGRPAAISYGTIVGLRPVTVQNSSGPGLGTAAGAVAGGVAGSFIGGDWRSNLLAGLGGAVIGGALGNAAERGVGSNNAVEFFVRLDRGGDISVVQTNEENLQFNDRVVIIHGDVTRISRASGNAPPAAFAPPQSAPPTYSTAPGGPTYYTPQGGTYR
jgi:outer membrane lipoprotein SlyB